jgi:hypothetical protein
MTRRHLGRETRGFRRAFRLWGIPFVAACSADNGSVPSEVAGPVPVLDGAVCTGDPANQRHDAPCLCCHRDEFGVAGSVDLESYPVSRVVVRDALDRGVEMTINPFGNFFQHFKVTPPLLAAVVGPDGRTLAMPLLAPDGDCNGCHRPGGSAAPIRGP